VRFSIYSEMQLWDEKSPKQLYDEVTEQVVNADRLGYDAYAIVEHFFFEHFSICPDPLSFFTQLAPSSTYPLRSQLRQLTYQALVD